jgi:hypothetical protein
MPASTCAVFPTERAIQIPRHIGSYEVKSLIFESNYSVIVKCTTTCTNGDSCTSLLSKRKHNDENDDGCMASMVDLTSGSASTAAVPAVGTKVFSPSVYSPVKKPKVLPLCLSSSSNESACAAALVKELDHRSVLPRSLACKIVCPRQINWQGANDHLKSNTQSVVCVLDATTGSSCLGLQERELIALRRLGKHPNIVSLHDTVTLPIHLRNAQGESEPIRAILLEHATNGDLFELIAQTGALSPLLLKRITVQCIRAVKHCHQHRLIHSDLKPDQWLIDENYQLKLCDFGFAQDVPIISNSNNVVPTHLGKNEGESDQTGNASTSTALETHLAPPIKAISPVNRIEGTLEYMAPELYQEMGQFTVSCVPLEQLKSFAIDLYGLGLVLFVCATGYPAFQYPDSRKCSWFRMYRTNPERFWREVHSRHSEKYGKQFSLDPRYTELLSGLLEILPEKRWTMSQVEQHSYIQEAVNEYDSADTCILEQQYCREMRERLQRVFGTEQLAHKD